MTYHYAVRVMRRYSRPALANLRARRILEHAPFLVARCSGNGTLPSCFSRMVMKQQKFKSTPWGPTPSLVQFGTLPLRHTLTFMTHD